MNCEKCFMEWTIQDLGNRTVKFCPFCGAEYKEKEPEEFASLVDCFKYLNEKFTHTIFFEPKKMLSYVSDYMPQLTVEKRILKVVLESGVYKQLLDDAGNVIGLNIEKEKFILVNDYGLSEKWAGEAVDWLVKAFDISPIKHVEKKESAVKTVVPSPKQKTPPVPASTTVKSNIITGSDEKGNYTYVGQTDALGRPCGMGELTYSSGEKFSGLFANGQLVGYGKWFSLSGQTFEGLFLNGKPAACNGVLTEKNGDMYAGFFGADMIKMGTIYHYKDQQKYPLKESYENGQFKHVDKRITKEYWNRLEQLLVVFGNSIPDTDQIEKVVDKHLFYKQYGVFVFEIQKDLKELAQKRRR